MKFNHFAKFALLLTLFVTGLVSCTDNEPNPPQGFSWSETVSGNGVFVVNEGNYMYGNSSLSYYNSTTKTVTNEIFYKANGEKLGDGGQSMAIRGGRGYVVVNNSGIISIIDMNSGLVVGTVEGLKSPRYIHFLSDTKAYVSDLYDSKITIFDPKTGAVTGSVATVGHASTEQMVGYGKYVFVNCWSYDNKILVVDTETDSVVDEIEVGIQPASIVIDKYNKIWALTDGGYQGSPYGWEAPSLYCIDAATRQIERQFSFVKGESPSRLSLNGAGDTLYFINKSVWKMDVTSEELPQEPFVQIENIWLYGMAVNPANSDIYVADAIDYVQAGMVYRYSNSGVLLDSFRGGIIPASFCFK